MKIGEQRCEGRRRRRPDIEVAERPEARMRSWIEGEGLGEHTVNFGGKKEQLGSPMPSQDGVGFCPPVLAIESEEVHVIIRYQRFTAQADSELAVHMSRGRGRKVPLVRHTGGNRGKQLSPQPSALTASHQAEERRW